jgi:hypothetical protein
MREAIEMQTFTVLWTSDLCRRIERRGLVGASPTMTFGGPHSSAPRYSRFGVSRGDTTYAVTVKDKRLYVVSRFVIERLSSAEEFVAEHPDWFAAIIAAEEPISERMAAWYAENPGYEARIENFRRLDAWLGAHPEIGAFNPGEADEVVLLRDALPVAFDRLVPGPIVRQLRWQQGRRPERGVKHLDDAGGITRSISLQGGVYRLTPEAASQLAAVVD